MSATRRIYAIFESATFLPQFVAWLSFYYQPCIVRPIDTKAKSNNKSRLLIFYKRFWRTLKRSWMESWPNWELWSYSLKLWETWKFKCQISTMHELMEDKGYFKMPSLTQVESFNFAWPRMLNGKSKQTQILTLLCWFVLRKIFLFPSYIELQEK